MFLGSLRTVKLLQILTDTAKQVRVVALESAGRVQYILDDLLQPFAVSLVRKGLFHSLDDGGYLFGQAFLFDGRYCRRAFVTEGVGIPVLVINYKGRNDLYVHVLLPDPETDVRGRGIALFQIYGNFHRQCVFDSLCKGTIIPVYVPIYPEET